MLINGPSIAIVSFKLDLSGASDLDAYDLEAEIYHADISGAIVVFLKSLPERSKYSPGAKESTPSARSG